MVVGTPTSLPIPVLTPHHGTFRFSVEFIFLIYTVRKIFQLHAFYKRTEPLTRRSPTVIPEGHFITAFGLVSVIPFATSTTLENDILFQL